MGWPSCWDGTDTDGSVVLQLREPARAPLWVNNPKVPFWAVPQPWGVPLPSGAVGHSQEQPCGVSRAEQSGVGAVCLGTLGFSVCVRSGIDVTPGRNPSESLS